MSHEEKRNIVFNKKEKKENGWKLTPNYFKLAIWKYFDPFYAAQNSSFKLRDVDLKVLKECKGNMPAL